MAHYALTIIFFLLTKKQKSTNIINIIKKNLYSELQKLLDNTTNTVQKSLDKNFNVKDFEINNFKHLLKYSSYKRENVEKV